ncbi:MAG: glycosyltransferase family 4 protein [Verrucomicrobiota bacterium]
MRLLFVHDRFGAMAGAEANIMWTATELKQRGCAVGLLHGAGTGRGEAAWSETFTHRFALTALESREGVRRAVSEFQPDVVYVHKMADLQVLEALADSGTPVARMVHDHELYCMRGSKYRYLTRKICTRAASPFCVVPCGAFLGRNRENGGRFPFKWVSYAAKRKEIRINQRFHRMVVATRYMGDELVRNGFDPARIEIHAPVPRTNDACARSTFSERNLIIYAGQIIRGKGVDVLLGALARVTVPFECLIFGDGSHRAHCERLSVALGLSDRVRFAGYVPQEELKKHYREASLAVMSSVWPEPFGAVGLEGMRHGLPVVAFDAGGIKEWLIDGDNGYLVPWMDRAQFAARVEELLLNKSLARNMGDRALQLIARRYDFGKYITGLEEMFTRVMAEAEPEQPVENKVFDSLVDQRALF